MRSILVASLLSLTAWAQPVLNPADLEFVSTAANGGLAEVEMGKLAVQIGLNKEVRDFGARLVADHEKANKELQKVVTAFAVVLPTKTDEEHQKHIDMLSHLMGAEFDSAFSKHMLEGHEKMVTLFKTQSKSAKAAPLRAFATATLPTLEAHLKIARALAQPRTSEL